MIYHTDIFSSGSSSQQSWNSDLHMRLCRIFQGVYTFVLLNSYNRQAIIIIGNNLTMDMKLPPASQKVLHLDHCHCPFGTRSFIYTNHSFVYSVEAMSISLYILELYTTPRYDTYVINRVCTAGSYIHAMCDWFFIGIMLWGQCSHFVIYI